MLIRIKNHAATEKTTKSIKLKHLKVGDIFTLYEDICDSDPVLMKSEVEWAICIIGGNERIRGELHIPGYSSWINPKKRVYKVDCGVSNIRLAK